MKVLLLIKAMPHNEAEAEYAKLLAEAEDGSITVMHVAADQSHMADGEAHLDGAVQLLGDMQIARRLVVGDVKNAILREIGTNGYNVVVIGARDDVPLVQRSMGAVARAIFKRSNASVLVVRRASTVLNRVLICTSGVESAEDVIRISADLAKASQARATLQHVVGPVPSMYTGLDQVEESLETLLQTETPTAQHLKRGAAILDEVGVEAELQLRHGVAADEILREAQLGDYDLVVIGATGSTNRVKEWLLGDVTKEIVNHVACPVLVVK